MKRIFSLAIVFCALCHVAGSAGDRRRDTARLVIMTINTRFMWDGLPPEEGEILFPGRNSPSEARKHMAEIARVIIHSNPDIVNLVEIENLEALRLLNDRFLTSYGYRPYFVEGVDTRTGQDLGLLTRVDPEGYRIERDAGLGRSAGVAKGVSKNYFAKFDINGHKVALVGLHLLSRPEAPDRRLPRQAQADLIGRRARKLAAQGYLPIVLGDFNDYDADVPDHIDSRPISSVLATIKRTEPGRSDYLLINVAEFVPKAERYTAFSDHNNNHRADHPRELSSIDHILIARDLKGFVESVTIPRHADSLEISDHYPIVMTLTLAAAAEVDPAADNRSGAQPRITRLLPNPRGNENENEEVTILNGGDAPIDLANLRLRDRAGATWRLSGTLGPGESIVVRRRNQSMAMNNGGDTIDLIDQHGTVIQSVTYGPVDEDEPVIPAS